MIDPFSAVSIASSGITVTTSPDYLLDALTASYVLLTLALAIIAFRSLRQTQSSLDLTRQQIELNTQQSQEASAASERHSQATIDAVNRQIEASERQAQEAIYNQYKPVLVCSYHPMAENSLRLQTLPIKNAGSSIALNIRVVLSYNSNVMGEKLQLGFIVPSVIIPGEKEDILIGASQIKDAQDKIGEYSFFPDDDDSSYNQRLVITYRDIFNRKHLSIFDGRLSTNWKLVALRSDYKYGIEDVCTDVVLLGGS
jgi:hypothetical protein